MKDPSSQGNSESFQIFHPYKDYLVNFITFKGACLFLVVLGFLEVFGVARRVVSITLVSGVNLFGLGNKVLKNFENME